MFGIRNESFKVLSTNIDYAEVTIVVSKQRLRTLWYNRKIKKYIKDRRPCTVWINLTISI
jgi:hypothetical protein